MSAEHDAMMEAFREKHGSMLDYQTQEERNMWLTWLGSFVLGWQAYREYQEQLQEATKNANKSQEKLYRRFCSGNAVTFLPADNKKKISVMTGLGWKEQEENDKPDQWIIGKGEDDAGKLET